MPKGAALHLKLTSDRSVGSHLADTWWAVDLSAVAIRILEEHRSLCAKVSRVMFFYLEIPATGCILGTWIFSAQHSECYLELTVPGEYLRCSLVNPKHVFCISYIPVPKVHTGPPPTGFFDYRGNVGKYATNTSGLNSFIGDCQVRPGDSIDR